MIERLRIELEKKLSQEFGWRSNAQDVLKEIIVIKLAIKKPRRCDPDQRGESWQSKFGEGVAIKYDARVDFDIYEGRGLMVANFTWDVAAIKDANHCIAAIKDFIAGIEAGGKIDVDEAINAARLSAALKAGISSVKKTERGDRGDLL